MLVLVLGILFVAQAQINHSPLPLNVEHVPQSHNTMRVPGGLIFAQAFDYLGYDYGGTVY